MPVTFEALKSAGTWKLIRNCPGRFILVTDDNYLSLAVFTGLDIAVKEYRSEKAKDRVIVAVLEGGGVISYKRDDGTYLHSLNTPDGFTRKLKQLEIMQTG